MDTKPSADGAGSEVTAGLDSKAARRRQSAFDRRKSSLAVEENAAVLEAHTLSEADRRLAEMGYTQVPQLLTSSSNLHPAYYSSTTP